MPLTQVQNLPTSPYLKCLSHNLSFVTLFHPLPTNDLRRISRTTIIAQLHLRVRFNRPSTSKSSHHYVMASISRNIAGISRLPRIRYTTQSNRSLYYPLTTSSTIRERNDGQLWSTQSRRRRLDTTQTRHATPGSRSRDNGSRLAGSSSYWTKLDIEGRRAFSTTLRAQYAARPNDGKEDTR